MCGGREWCCAFFQAPELLQRRLVQSYLSASIWDSYRVMLLFFCSFLWVLQVVWTLGRWLPKVCDPLLSNGRLFPLLLQLNEHAKLSMLRNILSIFFMHALPLFFVITWRYLCIKLLNEWRYFFVQLYIYVANLKDTLETWWFFIIFLFWFFKTTIWCSLHRRQMQDEDRTPGSYSSLGK